jgi:ABC-type glycerol-3-phosphate transport system substrate-binding protein
LGQNAYTDSFAGTAPPSATSGEEGSVRRMPELTVAAVMVLAAAGCTVDGPSGSNSYLANLSGRTVEVAATWSGTEEENFRAVLDEFARRTDVRVKYTSGGNDLAVLLNSRLAGGEPPDVAFIPQPGVVVELARRGVLKPLDSAVANDVRDNFSPAWRQLGTVDGKLYGVYFKVANKSVIWYRSDSFDEAGVAPPRTWDELRSVSRTLTDAGITPMVAAGGDGWVLTDWFENVYLRIGGPDRYDMLARHQLAWTDPTVVQSLQLLADYWRAPRTIEGGPTGALQVTFTQAVADVFGARPKSAMLYEGDFVASEIKKLHQMEVGAGAKFFEWPAINGSPRSVVAAGDQAVAFKDTPEANALMSFIASPEAAEIMAAKGGFLSANKNVDPAWYPDATTRALAAAVLNAPVLRFDLSDLTPQAFGGGSVAHMWVLLQDFLSQPIPAAELARRLEDAAQKDFGGAS